MNTKAGMPATSTLDLIVALLCLPWLLSLQLIDACLEDKEQTVRRSDDCCSLTDPCSWQPCSGLDRNYRESTVICSTKDWISTFVLLRMSSPAVSEELEGGACARRCPSRHVASRCPGASVASRLAGRQRPATR